jgi:dehydratase medium subunit
MADLARDRPCIHVCAIGAAAADLYRWVEIGAEEEGLPTCRVEAAEGDVVAAAYAAAQSSRFAIGVGIAASQVVLHEVHMPPAQPVLALDLGADAGWICRLMGSNAARLVVRLPLRFGDGPEAVPGPAGPSRSGHRTSPNVGGHAAGPAWHPGSQWGEVEVRLIARAVARILRERGLQ